MSSKENEMPRRPPIITIVGHINHGKSTLLRALRKKNLALKEAGDITQHIGAYETTVMYEKKERSATLIDTPGHAAFSHLRENGITIADIALLIVSAEEGWKEQTGEAYEAIQKTNIPFLVVFTKIDVKNANIERAKQSVLEHGILLESLGGTISWIGVSATTREGITSLFDLIFLTADLYEIGTTTTKAVEKSVGVSIEADVDAKTGIATTIIVLRKKIEKKQFVVIGNTISPVRIMQNDRGENIDVAQPSQPVRIIGFDGIPPVGEEVFVFDTKKNATTKQLSYKPKKERTQTQNISKATTECTLPIILKADTAGSATSVLEYFKKHNTHPEIHFKIIKIGIGAITEDDITFSAANESAYIIGFHTTIDSKIKSTMERLDTTCVTFATIYELSKWIEKICQNVLQQSKLKKRVGEATIIRMFQQQENHGAYICGMQIVHGVFNVNQKILIQRNGNIVDEYTIETIEQHTKKQESVMGEKTQFATKIKGNAMPQLQDTVIGLPNSSSTT